MNATLTAALIRWARAPQPEPAAAAIPRYDPEPIVALPPDIRAEAGPFHSQPADASPGPLPRPNAENPATGAEPASEPPKATPVVETPAEWEDRAKPASVDYYEVLQISRNAETETIHRVYRIMAARFHPDNRETGDLEKFVALRSAYHELSDPVRRAQYDVLNPPYESRSLPVFELKEFVGGLEGEKNRRLGVLSLLYQRRRMNEIGGGLSMLDLERRMSFPREYLSFTLWYLLCKGFIERVDNSDYGITVSGVDFVELHSASNPVIQDLLTAGSGTGATDPVHHGRVIITPQCPVEKKAPAVRRGRRRSANAAD